MMKIDDPQTLLRKENFYTSFSAYLRKTTIFRAMIERELLYFLYSKLPTIVDTKEYITAVLPFKYYNMPAWIDCNEEARKILHNLIRVDLGVQLCPHYQVHDTDEDFKFRITWD